MYYYNTVTRKISNVVIFTNHLLSAYILHKAKINTISWFFLSLGNQQNYC